MTTEAYATKLIFISLFSMGLRIINETNEYIKISVPKINDNLSDRCVDKEMSDSRFLAKEFKQQIDDIGYLKGRRVLFTERNETWTKQMYMESFKQMLGELS